MKRIIKHFSAAALLIAGIGFTPIQAIAADSVTVLGDIPTEQCPVGYQYSRGISIDVTNHITSTICNAPPNAEDILRMEQDRDFWDRQQAATKAAEDESRAWNNANPGMQKCVQWGPIVHANGVSTSSGGVCANPIAANESTGVPAAPAESIVAISQDVTEVVVAPIALPSPGSPNSVTLDGQRPTTDCPAGYQGANGIAIDVQSGKVTTECWSPAAWTAMRLGGEVWEKWNSSGGTYDVFAEVARRDKVADLKAQAKAIAEAASKLTPGTKRCSAWTGYGETGQECGYTFINPNDAPVVKTPTTSSSADSTDVTVVAPIAPPTAPVVDAAQIVAAKYVNIVKVAKSKITLKALTPLVCKVLNLRVTAKKVGTCKIRYIITNSKGVTKNSTRTIVFTKIKS